MVIRTGKKNWILHNTTRPKKPLFKNRKKSVVLFAALIWLHHHYHLCMRAADVLFYAAVTVNCFYLLASFTGVEWTRPSLYNLRIVWTAIAAAAAVATIAVSSCFALFVISCFWPRRLLCTMCIYVRYVYRCLSVCLSVCLRWFALFVTRIDLMAERCNVDVGARGKSGY